MHIFILVSDYLKEKLGERWKLKCWGVFELWKKLGFCGNVVLGDIPAATAEDVELAVDAARKALARNKGRDWANASGAVRARYMRAIAAKVLNFCYQLCLLLWIA